jgi:hypothetical protein
MMVIITYLVKPIIEVMNLNIEIDPFINHIALVYKILQRDTVMSYQIILLVLLGLEFSLMVS